MNELTISLQPKSGKPLYEQIYSYIKEDIQNGRMKSSEKLPSTRSLCKYLEVSRSTVELAYEQLLSEGYVKAIPYKGYYVTDIKGLYQIKNSSREYQEKDFCKQALPPTPYLSGRNGCQPYFCIK